MENNIVSRMGMNPVREKWMRPIFAELFARVGETLTPEYLAQPDWYTLHSWTAGEQRSFSYWLYRYLKRRMPWKLMSEKRLKNELGWFILSYGWKEKEGIY